MSPIDAMTLLGLSAYGSFLRADYAGAALRSFIASTPRTTRYNKLARYLDELAGDPVAGRGAGDETTRQGIR